ncbi:MAG: U32 family peptidase [Lachnospiraceae bacterium]|nr:U32 family peptidase [Lachnospiraceae bacterium]
MKPELLMPAGSPEILKAVIDFGADAVYVGGETLSLRAKAKNFTEEELREGLRYAHARGKKVYLAVNIVAHEDDLPGAEALFGRLHEEEQRPDALILSDPGIFRLSQRLCPEIPVHLSTQASAANAETFRFWYEQGVRRIVCARELSLEEITRIRSRIPPELELECFVHGAMCMSYSGRCLISNFLASRDANRGACTHPCRWKYYLTEEKRPGQYMPVEEDDRGTYLYNSKDLCMIAHLPDLLSAGVSSLKVEGRMKTLLYAVSVTRAYRQALDDLEEDPARYEAGIPAYEREVSACTTRGFCTGFYYGPPGADAQNYESSEYRKNYTYLGMVREEAGRFTLIQKNKFSVGDAVEILRPGCKTLTATVLRLTDEHGTDQPCAPHPAQKLILTLDKGLQADDILRKENHDENI